MAQTIYGSVARPVSLDHFQVIREVHWDTGRVGIVTIEYSELNRYGVEAIIPIDGMTDGFSGSEGTIIRKDDYKEKQILSLPISGNKGTIHTEDEISPVYIGDAFTSSSGYVTHPASNGKYIGLEQHQDIVADLTASIGRAPDLDVIGALITPINATYTHPNGHTVTYISGWTSITFSPPDFDWTDTASAVWYHASSIPAQEAVILQKAWLVNFASRKVNDVLTPYITEAGIRATSMSMSFDAKYKLEIYSSGTEFKLNADGTVTANKDARITQSGVSPSSDNGIIKRFNKDGFITT
jgi:hypothetical protein